MKCPQCNAEFRLTWAIYLKAPFGRFPCPSCGTRLTEKHRWWYWPTIVLGCCVFALASAWLAGLCFGLRGRLGGGVVGALVLGVLLDKFLESRYSILEIRQNATPKPTPPAK